MDQPRNLVIVASVLVFGVGGLAINLDGFSLQGVSLCGVAAVLLNFLLPKAPTEASEPQVSPQVRTDAVQQKR